MSRNEHFQILHIKTCALKVNIHCDGCKEKVKKILRKIEGVYSVDVDAEKQKVKVSGNVDSTTLINKLLKSGKYAELWPSHHHDNQNQELLNFINGGSFQNQMQNPKSQPLLTPGYSLEDHLREQNFIPNMDMNNNHAHMAWNDNNNNNNDNILANGSLNEEDNSPGFIELDGSQLEGFYGSFNGGIRAYHDHQPSMMNTYQQSHLEPMIMNRNVHDMHNFMGHCNMNMQQPWMMNHAHPVFPHARYY